MSTTAQNSAMVLSIGIVFSLMIVGLSSSLPDAMNHGLAAQGVPAADAARISHLPPVGLLFASFLGYNPMQHLLGPSVLQHLSHAHGAYLTGRTYFRDLTFDQLHRMQFDLETTGLEAARDRIFMIAVRDPAGATDILEARGGGDAAEAELIRALEVICEVRRGQAFDLPRSASSELDKRRKADREPMVTRRTVAVAK